MRAYLLCVPLCVLLGLTHRGAPLSKQPLSLGGIALLTPVGAQLPSTIRETRGPASPVRDRDTRGKWGPSIYNNYNYRRLQRDLAAVGGY